MSGYVDEIWIGNWGRYNEGELIGEWMELPFDRAKLDDFLIERCGVDAMHEEVGIFDTSLDGPLGDLGVEIGEHTPIESVLLLADIVENNPTVDLDHVSAYLESEGERDPEAAANAVLQADDIPAGYLIGSEIDYSSQDERIGYTMVERAGGLDSLSREELARHFDFDRYGRELIDCGDYRLTASGAVDLATAEIDIDGCDRESVIGRAEWLPSFPGDAVDYLKSTWGARDAGDDPELDAAAAALAWDLDTVGEEKLRCAADCLLPALPTTLQIANAAIGVDGGEVSLIELDDVSPASLAYTLLDGAVLGQPSLQDYFDYESYGEWMGQDLIICGDVYIDATEDGPDLKLYDLDDLRCEAGWETGTLDELESECVTTANLDRAAPVERAGDAR